jgi:hypothetical protein
VRRNEGPRPRDWTAMPACMPQDVMRVTEQCQYPRFLAQSEPWRWMAESLLTCAGMQEVPSTADPRGCARPGRRRPGRPGGPDRCPEHGHTGRHCDRVAGEDARQDARRGVRSTDSALGCGPPGWRWCRTIASSSDPIRPARPPGPALRRTARPPVPAASGSPRRSTPAPGCSRPPRCPGSSSASSGSESPAPAPGVTLAEPRVRPPAHSGPRRRRRACPRDRRGRPRRGAARPRRRRG